MGNVRRIPRKSHAFYVDQLDHLPPGTDPGDTMSTGFPSLDKILGGGLRQRDLLIIGGDVGSGKSALALGIALRAAGAGVEVAFASGEMHEERLVERALTIEGKQNAAELRSGHLGDEARSRVGATALMLDRLPITFHSLVGNSLAEALSEPLERAAGLLVIDYLQLLPPHTSKNSQDEETASTLRSLKALTMKENIACMLVSQMPELDPTRPNPRPQLEDFGALGAIKQHSDVILSLFRQEMYDPGPAVRGAAELIVAKNRNGPTGYVDLYFHQQWMRFEDMLDPTGEVTATRSED